MAVEMSSGPGCGGAPLGSAIVNVMTKSSWREKKSWWATLLSPCYKQKDARPSTVTINTAKFIHVVEFPFIPQRSPTWLRIWFSESGAYSTHWFWHKLQFPLGFIQLFNFYSILVKPAAPLANAGAGWHVWGWNLLLTPITVMNL